MRVPLNRWLVGMAVALLVSVGAASVAAAHTGFAPAPCGAIVVDIVWSPSPHVHVDVGPNLVNGLGVCVGIEI